MWEHTRVALSTLTKKEFLQEFPDDPITIETIMGALFHDIGKPATLQTPEHHGTDRYRYYGHDSIGSQMASAICNRLKLTSLPKESNLHVSCERLEWIVKKHLLLLNSNIAEIRASTIEKYFFNPRLPGTTLLQVILADSLATIPASGKSILDHFRQMKLRIEELLELSSESGASHPHGLPEPLLNGNDIMDIFGLAPGPKVGKLLRIIREEQLEGKLYTKSQGLARVKKELTLPPNDLPHSLRG